MSSKAKDCRPLRGMQTRRITNLNNPSLAPRSCGHSQTLQRFTWPLLAAHAASDVLLLFQLQVSFKVIIGQRGMFAVLCLCSLGVACACHDHRSISHANWAWTDRSSVKVTRQFPARCGNHACYIRIWRPLCRVPVGAVDAIPTMAVSRMAAITVILHRTTQTFWTPGLQAIHTHTKKIATRTQQTEEQRKAMVSTMLQWCNVWQRDFLRDSRKIH